MLFRFMTPQFGSRAQSAVAMLRPDSPSSRPCLLAVQRCPRAPQSVLIVPIAVGGHASKHTVNAQRNSQKQTLLLHRRGPGLILHVRVAVFPAPTQGVGLVERPHHSPRPVWSRGFARRSRSISLNRAAPPPARRGRVGSYNWPLFQ